jgi:ribose transport system substrate-binding protein
MLSIPNTSTNQFVRGVMDGEAEVGKEIGLTVRRWENQGQPSQWVQGIDYAISNHFTMLDLIAGINPAVVDPQLRQANAAGLKSFASLYYDVSQPPDPLLAASLALNYHDDMGAVLADWMAVHSDGHARVIIIKSDEVLPTAPLVAGIHDEFKKNCPNCKIEQEINVGITEWATKIQPSLQSALLSHPDANYVVPIYDSMTQFVVPAIAVTGTAHRVKIATADGTPYVLDMLRRGQVEMDIGESLDWSARATLDGYMRRMCNLKTPTQLLIPFHIFSAANILSAGIPAQYSKGYGDAYKADFAKLWMMQ